MSALSYQETIEWLFHQFPSYQHIGGKAYKPGLENIHKLLDYFGNPQHDLTFIHVAGTNGKGSTCSMLASILTESKQRVGLFTSPHIQDFRERIRVNGSMISETFVVECTHRIKIADLPFEPSFFEISFLMALLYFQSQKCTICVIETGLGGRLDATNCITPLISVITNISLEHTQFLGGTLPEIAGEKAGIIKPYIPVVIGERNVETDSVFESTAQKNNASIVFASDVEIIIPDYFPLLGNYQQSNYRLVKSVLDQLKLPITTTDIEAGLKNLTKNTGFYGRLQVMQKDPVVIFDVSHNEAGIKATLDFFKSTNRLLIVYGTSADKNMEDIFKLFPENADYFFTQFENNRSASVEQLTSFALQNDLKSKFFKNSLVALDAAKSAANKEDTILVFGSFFLISDFFEKK